jgi:hypothetical protein
MSAATNQRPAYYARMICEHMKRLPNFYAGDLKDVQEALGISDAAFKMGVDWCIARKIIVMETKAPTPAVSADVESEAMKGDSSRLSSMLRSPSYAEAS